MMRQESHALITIFCVALIARLFFLTLIFQSIGTETLTKGDAHTFLTIAENLASSQTYSSVNATSPTANYVPLYPLFLFLTGGNTSSVIIPLILQCLLGAIIAIIIYHIGTRAGLTTRAAKNAALLWAIEPGVLFYTNQIYTEILFTTFLLLSLFFLFEQKFRYDIASSLCLGLATLTRPIALYILPLYIIFICTRTAVKKIRVVCIGMIFIGIYFLVLSPWVIRNYIQFGIPMLSTQSSYLVAASTIPAYISWNEHRSFTDAQNIVATSLIPFGYSEEFVLRGNKKTHDEIILKTYNIIREDPLGFIWSQMRFAPQFFLSSGWQSAYDTLRNKNEKPVQYGDAPPHALLRIAGSSMWLMLSILACIGAILSLYRRESFVYHHLLLILIIGIFLLLTGPLAHARYRIPVVPFFIILTVYTVDSFRQQKTKKY